MRFIRRATLFGLLALARGFVLEPRRAAARCVASSGGASELDAPPPTMPPPPKKVLLLMSDTGGGHRASAEALAAAFDALHPGAVACEVVDLWADHARWPFDTYPAAYAFMAKQAPWLYKLLYELTALPPARALYDELVLARCGANFGAALGAAVAARERADAVVSVHPLLNNVPRRVLARLDDQQGRPRGAGSDAVRDGRDRPGACHPTWFDRDVDPASCPAKRSSGSRAAGMPDASLRRRGLPLREGRPATAAATTAAVAAARRPTPRPRPARDALASRAAADRAARRRRRRRRRLGGGAPRSPRAGRGRRRGPFFRSLSPNARSRSRTVCDALRGVAPRQLVVGAAATRARARSRARGRARRRGGRRGGRRRASAQGFVDDMHVWMTAADVVVTKAARAASPRRARRPADAVDDVPARSGGGQRRGARARDVALRPARALSVGMKLSPPPLSYVVDGGFGAYETDPAAIGATVARCVCPAAASGDETRAVPRRCGEAQAPRYLSLSSGSTTRRGSRR